MSPVGVPAVQSAAVVAAVSVICLDPGNGTSPKLQVKVLRPACGLAPQAVAVKSVPPTVQLLVAGPGRTTLMVTPGAVIRPLFGTVTVNTAFLAGLAVSGEPGARSGGCTTST